MFEDKDGRQIKKIKDWSKRNDHRHHAMDALTVAFTKDVFIQYFNNKNAFWMSGSKEHANITAIRNKYFGNGKAVAPVSYTHLSFLILPTLTGCSASYIIIPQVCTRKVR